MQDITSVSTRGDRNPQNAKEFFNEMHSQLQSYWKGFRNHQELVIWDLKYTPRYSIPVHVSIVNACCVLYSFIRDEEGQVFGDELHDPWTTVEENTDNYLWWFQWKPSGAQARSQTFTYNACILTGGEDEWKRFRDSFTVTRWNEHLGNRNGYWTLKQKLY